MVQAGGQLNLSKKALAAKRFREIGTQHFDRDASAVPVVVCQVDSRHAARTELAVEAIAIGQCIDERRGSHHVGRVH